jgi:hypothetical protein
MTLKQLERLSDADREILRRALNGHLVRPGTRLTTSLVEVLRDHFAKIDLTDQPTTCLGWDS